MHIQAGMCQVMKCQRKKTARWLKMLSDLWCWVPYYATQNYTIPRQHAIDCRRDINNKSIVLRIEEEQQHE